jgi:hypothetical protein
MPRNGRRWLGKPPLGYGLDRSHPLARGLVGCWLFNEGGGNLLGDLAGGRGGALAGGAWNAGPAGPEVAFNGSSTVATVASYAAIESLSRLTIVAEVRANNRLGGFQEVVRKGSTGTAWFLLVNGSGTWAFSADGTNFGDTSTPSANGERAFLVGTHDGSRTKLYKNSALYEDIAETTIGNNADPLAFGALATGSQYFNGWIGRVYLYDRALSADEAAWITAEPNAFLQVPAAWRYLAAAGAPSPAFFDAQFARPRVDPVRVIPY